MKRGRNEKIECESTPMRHTSKFYELWMASTSRGGGMKKIECETADDVLDELCREESELLRKNGIYGRWEHFRAGYIFGVQRYVQMLNEMTDDATGDKSIKYIRRVVSGGKKSNN